MVPRSVRGLISRRGLPHARPNLSRQNRGVSAVPCKSRGLGNSHFQPEYQRPEGPLPFVLSREPGDLPQRESELPASCKWFHGDELGPYLKSFSSAFFPYELTVYPRSVSSLEQFHQWLCQSENSIYRAAAGIWGQALSQLSSSLHDKHPRLCQLDAPLALLVAALEFNKRTTHPVTQLYIAQAPISELPPELQEDLPVPEALTAGNGRVDIYNTSIWMGLEPTFTPWHRDPNPNLFRQLCGSKAIRLMPPAEGEQVFRQTQARLGRMANPRIRTVDMFEGPERSAWYETIWGSAASSLPGLSEAILKPNDSLFIPQGWWHSVKSSDSTDVGKLNASVNWWFRDVRR